MHRRRYGRAGSYHPKRLDFHLEQVQDFTPTPMTIATEAWYTGYHPYTLQPVLFCQDAKGKIGATNVLFLV